MARKFKARDPLTHGDWKTVSVHPHRWPTIPVGTEVELVKEWSNFYGIWFRIKGPNGEDYDVEPYELIEVCQRAE